MTDRDYNLLVLVSKSGAVSNEQAHVIYGEDKSSYYLKRLKILSNEGYIKRRKGFVTLKIKGLKAVGISTKPEKKKDYIVRKKAEMAELFFRLEGWQVVFGTEFKNMKALNRGSRIEAVIRNGDYEFAIFQMSSKTPKANTVAAYLNEINTLPRKAGINRAVIFCQTECAEIILNRINKPTVEELLLLPYPRGMSLIENRYNIFFDEILIEEFPGIKKGVSTLNLAEYTWVTKDGVYYISDLLTNDAVKMYHLDNFYSNKLTVKMEKKIIILCPHAKYQEIRKRYPKAIVRLMTDTLSRFVPTPDGG